MEEKTETLFTTDAIVVEVALLVAFTVCPDLQAVRGDGKVLAFCRDTAWPKMR